MSAFSAGCDPGDPGSSPTRDSLKKDRAKAKTGGNLNMVKSCVSLYFMNDETNRFCKC